MHWTVRKAAAVMTILAGMGLRAQAQRVQPFDPEVDGQCEKALSHGPESDWIGDARSFDVQCADLDLRIEGSKLAALRKSMADSSQAERSAFDALATAFERFRKLHMDLATKSCGGGVGCSSSNEMEEAHITYQFLNMAEGFKTSGFPSYSARDAAAADTKLNDLYKRALQTYLSVCAHPTSDDPCASQADLRDTERAWIRYRDSWVAFGAIRWPQVSEDSWRAYLTLQHMQGDHDFSVF